MAETATCPTPECIDSPVVTTGTIMGILTFIYALLIGLIYTYIQLSTLSSSLDETILSYESISRQLSSLRSKLNFYNETLPSRGVLREELYGLYGELKRCEDIVNDKVTRKLVDEVGDYRHFDRAKKVRALMKDHAVLDALRGRVGGAREAVSGVMGGLVVLKQDIIHADQTAKLNVLFDILLDPGKRRNEEEIRGLRTQFEGASGAEMGKNEAVESIVEKDQSLESGGN